MNWKKATRIIVWASVFGILGYDALAVQYGGVDSSISALIKSVSHDWPVVPFMAGFLCGHLWFGMGKRDRKCTNTRPDSSKS
jgi:hypothetical protein